MIELEMKTSFGDRFRPMLNMTEATSSIGTPSRLGAL